MKSLPVFFLAFGLLLPAAAGASTVTVRPDPSGSGEEVYYQAASGEANVLEIAYAGDARSVTVTDPGATITAQPGCTNITEHIATCTPQDGTFLQGSRAELGDGNDTLTTSRPGPAVIGGVVANGGPGDDHLDGGAGPDDLNGGGGTDTLLGGGGHDKIADGDTDENADADVMDGGVDEDADLVSYEGRRNAVTVDLTATTAGAEGENDEVSNFAQADGGDGDDRLLGDDEENTFHGNAGNDVIKGRGGHRKGGTGDFLVGGSGADKIRGGDDRDVIVLGKGRDRISCGSGSDVVIRPQGDEILTEHCELVRWIFGDEGLDSMQWDPNPDVENRRVVRQQLSCPRLEETDGTSVACSGTLRYLELGGKRRLLGEGRFAAESERAPFGVKVRLTKLGRRLARRRSGVDVSAHVKGTDIPRAGWGFHLTTR